MDDIDELVAYLNWNRAGVTRRTVLKAAFLGVLPGLLAAHGGVQSTAGADSDGKPRRGGTLKFATTVATPSLHPYNEISDARMRRSPLMYDTLVEWGQELSSIVPGLAEKWELAGKTWTFHLRRGVQFSDGKELDADDVIYSMEQVLKSPGRGFYSSIERMEAPDEATVRFHLKQESASLLWALGGRFAFIIPKGAADKVNLGATAIGTGAFTVKKFEPHQHLVLERNPHHWNADKVYLDALTILEVPDESNIVAGLRSGRIDVAIFERPENFLLAQNSSGLVPIRQLTVRWSVLDILALDTPPFSDVTFRQAIATALDREAILNLAIKGLGTPLAVLPPVFREVLATKDDPFYHPRGDPAKAKSLLAQSSYKGNPLTLVTIVGYSDLLAAAQVIVENLSRIGLKVEIQQQELGVWIKLLNARQFKTFSMNAWGGWVDPDLLFYNHFHVPPEGRDFRRWNNGAISKLLDEARFTVDQKKRALLYTQVQKTIVEQVPLIPLYSADLLGAYRSNVQNVTWHPSSYYQNLRSVWISR